MLSILSSLVYSFRTAQSGRLRWLGLTTLVTLAIVTAEYALNALLNPEITWSPTGVAAHAVLDLGLTWPLVAITLLLGHIAARRLGMKLQDGAGLLGTIGLYALTFLILTLPVNTVRDIPHELTDSH